MAESSRFKIKSMNVMDYEFVSVQKIFIWCGRSKLLQSFELIYALRLIYHSLRG